MARPARFELATLCLEGRRSIQLSYGRISYVDSKSFIARDDTILEILQDCLKFADSASKDASGERRRPVREFRS